MNSNYMTTSGTAKVLNEVPYENDLSVGNKAFFPSAVTRGSGNPYSNRSVFSPQGYSVWGSSVFNPAASANVAKSEDTRMLASQDDLSITGISFVGSSSPYYPKQQQ